MSSFFLNFWFFSPEYRIVEQSEHSLVIETSSGRSGIALMIGLVSIYLTVWHLIKQEIPVWQALSVTLINIPIIIGITYRNEWTFERKEGIVHHRIKILERKIYELNLDMNDVKTISIKKEIDSNEGGVVIFLLYLNELQIAKRTDCKELYTILQKIRNFLPESVLFLRNDCE